MSGYLHTPAALPRGKRIVDQIKLGNANYHSVQKSLPSSLLHKHLKIKTKNCNFTFFYMGVKLGLSP
jgi:hypothetical protein